jgi:hypothetical protein
MECGWCDGSGVHEQPLSNDGSHVRRSACPECVARLVVRVAGLEQRVTDLEDVADRPPMHPPTREGPDCLTCELSERFNPRRQQGCGSNNPLGHCSAHEPRGG